MICYRHDTIFKRKSKINLSDFVITISLFCLIIILLLNPTRYSNATLDGLKLFLVGVFPTLFPFVFISKILSALQTPLVLSNSLKNLSHKLFHAPSCISYVYLLSILCGYPIGAKLTGDLFTQGIINHKQVKQLTYFCSTSGLLFVIGTIGTIMFGSSLIGIIIYVSHILGCFIGGLILSRIDKQPDFSEKPIPHTASSNIISESITSSIKSIVIVGAYITLFCLFTKILCDLTIFKYILHFIELLFDKLGIPTNLASGLVTGIFEMTNGCKQLSMHTSNAAIILASGIISFGGISILLQSQTFLKNTKIKARTLLFTKFVHAICSMIICYIILLII